jgi:hypothetical protein
LCIFCVIFGCKYTVIGINNAFTFTHSCPNATVIFDTAVGFYIVQSFAPSYTKSKSSPIGGTKIFGVTSRFTSIYNGINATVVYALDVAICVGEYLTSSYTKQTGDQVDM